jgi:Flp pilus assembly protein TadG
MNHHDLVQAFQSHNLNGGTMRSSKSIRSRVRRLRTQSAGQSLVEFAIISVLLFLLMFAILDFGRLFYVKTTLQSALREAGRLAVTGRHLPDPNNPGSNLSRIDSIIATAQRYAMGVDISNIEISSPLGGVTRPAGGPRETVIISLTTDLKLLTLYIGRFFGSSGVYHFTVSTAFLNEPFDPSQIH